VSGKARTRSSRGRRRPSAGGPALTVITGGGRGDSRGTWETRYESEPATRREDDSDAVARRDDDPESVARLICLRLLTAAPRTRAQLADVLRRRGVPEDAAAAVLARFAEVGLIDDAMFASAWVESRHHGRGLGRRALAAELSQRGIDRAEIQAAVDRLSPETELATARALVERRLASTAGQPAQVRARRLAAMLARKGYPSGLAYRVVREAIERAGQDAIGGFDDDPFDDGCEVSEPD
jgi:regulatory protein